MVSGSFQILLGSLIKLRVGLLDYKDIATLKIDMSSDWDVEDSLRVLERLIETFLTPASVEDPAIPLLPQVSPVMGAELEDEAAACDDYGGH